MEQLLHFAGGFFVLFLAYGAVRSFRNYTLNQAVLSQSARQNIFKAVTVNFLNPNPYLSWSLVMGPLLLKGWREAPGNGVAFVGSFYFTMIVITGGIIVLFAALRKLGPQISRILIGISAVALAGFGFYQIWLGVAGYL